MDRFDCKLVRKFIEVLFTNVRIVQKARKHFEVSLFSARSNSIY